MLREHDIDEKDFELVRARRQSALATIQLLKSRGSGVDKSAIDRLRINAREYINISKCRRDIGAPGYISEESEIVAEACLELIRGQLAALRNQHPGICEDDCIPELCSLLAEGA
ncbi:MAG: hypothetical protein ACOYUZ_04210 [Patescibacteria group bacterium]